MSTAQIMATIVAGVVMGAAGGLIVGFLVGRHVAKTRCQHNRIETISFRQYLHHLAAVCTCLDCGKGGVEFNLGYVADTESARIRAARATLQAKGYRQESADKNVWIKEAA